MTSSKMTVSSRIVFVRAFAMENGLFLTLQKVLGAIFYRSRDQLLARRLKTSGLHIGSHPKLSGLHHIRLGENFSAGNGLWLDAITHFAGRTYQPLIEIGRGCNLSDNVHIACTHRVLIAENFLCGSRVIISDHSHGLYSGFEQSHPDERPVERQLTNDKAVTIGHNVWIGDGVAILGGAQIGDGAIIGANSVVTGVIPSNTIAAGTPARPIARWDDGAAKWIRIPRSDAQPPSAQ